MSINKSLESMKFDVRLIDYHLNDGTLTKADVEKHSKELPDLSANVLESSDLDSDEDIDLDSDIDDSDPVDENQAH
jgi:hypothetical protein